MLYPPLRPHGVVERKNSVRVHEHMDKRMDGCMLAYSGPNKTLIQDRRFTEEPSKAPRNYVNYTRMLSGRAESTFGFPNACKYDMIAEPEKQHWEL